MISALLWSSPCSLCCSQDGLLLVLILTKSCSHLCVWCWLQLCTSLISFLFVFMLWTRPTLTILSKHAKALWLMISCVLWAYSVTVEIPVSNLQNGMATEINIKLGVSVNCKQLSITRPLGGMVPGSYCILCLLTCQSLHALAIL